MRSTLKFAIAVAVLASTVLLYRRLTTTGPVDAPTDVEDATAGTTDATTTAATGD